MHGFSLTELMVGSLVGLLVIAGALQLYMLNLRGTTDNLRLSRLNQELRATLELLRNDLRRAGYWAIEPGAANPADNPFQADGVDVRLGQAGVGPSGTAGPNTSNANLEQFGFRLRAGQVQMRNGGGTFDCTSGSWQAVTEQDTEITAFGFEIAQDCINLRDLAQPCAIDEPALLRRRVHIAIDGRSRSDNGIVQQLDSTVVVANDKLLALFAP
jgi:type IV pilus assembly protein PilW